MKNREAIDSAHSDYDFCHHCKQLKNKNLLVSCNYSSKGTKTGVIPSTGGSSQVGNSQNYVYAPYPYEP
jgi:hypothetical protein